MNKANGKNLGSFYDPEILQTPPINPDSTVTVGNNGKGNLAPVKKTTWPLMLVPFTPVSMNSPMGWGRIIAYGMVAAFTWKRVRPVSITAISAAGISLATSLASTAINGD